MTIPKTTLSHTQISQAVVAIEGIITSEAQAYVTAHYPGFIWTLAQPIVATVGQTIAKGVVNTLVASGFMK